MLEDIVACAIAMWMFRFIISVLLPVIHGPKSEYWEVSAGVGIVGIIFFVITQGIYVNENYNIGTAIGFFWMDMYRGGLGYYMKKPLEWFDFKRTPPKSKKKKPSANDINEKNAYELNRALKGSPWAERK